MRTAKSCQSAWRSASALYRGIKPQEGTGAPRAPLTCHCEERSDVAISQYSAASWESYRRKRNCLPEIATSAFGLLAMTNRGPLSFYRYPTRIGSIAPGPAVPSLQRIAGAMGKTPLSTLNFRCHCEERSDVAISQYTVGSWGSLRRNRSCLPGIATSAFGLLAMTREGGSCRLVPASLRRKQASGFIRPAGGYPRTGISSNPGRAPMPRRGSDCSRPDCAPRPPRASARRPAA